MSRWITFNAEQTALMETIELIDRAYARSEWAPVRESLHVAKIEAERRLGEMLLAAARVAPDVTDSPREPSAAERRAMGVYESGEPT